MQGGSTEDTSPSRVREGGRRKGILDNEPAYSQQRCVRRDEQVRIRRAEQGWGKGEGRRKILNMGPRRESKQGDPGRREGYQEEAADRESACGAEKVIRASPPRRPAFPSGRRGSGQSPGVGVPEGLDQALLLLLEAGEATGGPGCGGGGALGQGEEPAHPPRDPGPEALDGSGLLLPAASPAVLQRRRSGRDARGPNAGRPRLL